MGTTQNILDAFLGQLEVKHTGSFTDQYFNEHPYRYNLLGLSRMLYDYGVENGATQITDKEQDISEIVTPFIAQFGGSFITVYKVDLAQVTFLWEGVNHVLPVDKFIESWTGVVLLAKASEKSIEPDYKAHRKAETLNLLKKVALISALGFTVILAYIYNLNAPKTAQSLRQSINSLKADEDVFSALLKKQPYYETNDCDSIIRFGNPDSKQRITVFSNPLCNPCAKMHKRIEELLVKTNNGIFVRYFLSSFTEDLNSTNKLLIASCFTNNSALLVFNDWFEKGKALRDDYFKDMGLDMENPAIEVEFRKHEAWKQRTQLKATPTVLVNGYKMPESYKIEDLHYFTNLDFSF